jgi:O-antigen ligase
LNKKLQIISEKSGLIAAIIFAVLLPYNMLYSTVAIYLIVLIAILSFRKEKLKRIPKESILFSGIFLLSLSGYYYSTDIGRAGYLLERQLTIIVFPFLLPLAFEINSKNLKLIFRFFSLSCIFAVIYLFGLCLYNLQINHLPISSLSLPHFYHHNFSQPINIHAGFLSLYISLAISYIIYEMSKVTKPVKFICLLAIFLLCGGLYFLASRNSIIAVLLVICFVFPVFMAGKKRLVVILITFSVAAIFLFFGKNSNYLNQRFSKELLGDLQINSLNAKVYPESRIVRWQCAIDLIKQKPYFGYGTGDEIPLLKNEYRKRKMWVSYFEEFNTHNQYLAITLKHGFLGLFLFISMLCFFFYLSIKSGSFMYFSFLFLLTVGFFTENIIDANKGIFFFAFFNTLLGYQILNNKTQKKQTI